MVEEYWDLVILGAGPAGLTAGIYGARSGLKTLLLEMELPGGCISKAALIENYPGFPEGISGSALAEKLKEHCENAGAVINVMERVLGLDLMDETKRVTTNRGTYDCKALIIATGTHHRQLGVSNEDRLNGRGVSYCALCDGPLFMNKDVLVVGGGNAAAIDALFLSDIASRVRLVHRRSTLRAENALIVDMISKGVDILYSTEVKGLKGDDKVVSAVLSNNETGDTSEVYIDGVFVQIGMIPNSEIARTAGVVTDENGYIVVDGRQRTNVKGVFAAGDVTATPYRQCGTAVGNAVVAAIEAHGYIKRPYYYRE
jgi:thioredoxin reductase (NADPH)